MSAPTRPPTRSGGGGTAARKAARESEATSGATTRAARDRGSGSAGSGAGATVADRRPAAPLDPDALAALEEQRDFLLRSLRDLEREHDAGDLDDGDYAALKDDYTARAAAVLRAIEGHQTAMAARPRGSRGRTLAIAALIVVAALVVGAVLAQALGRRSAGDSATGDIRQTSRDLLAKARSETAEANQALQSGDGTGAVEHFKAAIKAYDDALQADPANAEAMTYRGWLLHTLAVNGPADRQPALDQEAASWLDRAIVAKPDYPDAHVFKAILLRNAGDLAGARAELAKVPDSQIPPFMQQMVQGLRASVDGSEPSGSSSAGSAPPGSTAPGSPSATP
ncbi:MAG: hypothetical protein U0Q07_12060 [Acidimicrobiales bacterium]